VKLEELRSWLDSQDEWDYQVDDDGVLMRNDRLETLTHASFRAIEANSLEALTAACAQGKDVDHITRVTGYFSRTSGWNKGKAGELKDRYRSEV
jgi:hypothetical protein